MPKKLTLLHTSSKIVGPATEMAKEIIPEVDILHLVDESLLARLRSCGCITPQIKRRVADYVVGQEQEGVDAVMLTCSSISPCADIARELVDIPVIKIDEAMITKAIEVGTNIAVVATLPITLNPTKQQLQVLAEKSSTQITIKEVLCSEAFDALIKGQSDKHDAMVLEEIEALASQVDVIILAQASMARLALQVRKEIETKVMTSLKPAMQQAREILLG